VSPRQLAAAAPPRGLVSIMNTPNQRERVRQSAQAQSREH